MILTLLNNNKSRAVIGVEFEDELDKICHGSFNGTEKYITVDKGYVQEWTVHYENGSRYSFSRGGVISFGKDVTNILKYSTILLSRNLIVPELDVEFAVNPYIAESNLIQYSKTDYGEDGGEAMKVNIGRECVLDVKKEDFLKGGIYERISPDYLASKGATLEYRNGGPCYNYPTKICETFISDDFIRAHIYKENDIIRVTCDGEIYHS